MYLHFFLCRKFLFNLTRIVTPPGNLMVFENCQGNLEKALEIQEKDMEIKKNNLKIIIIMPFE